jgi:DNA polymerase III subunit epsilon
LSSKKIKQQRYAIVDIETTGGMPKRDKIIEIAIVIHDGVNIIDQYSSLVNPQRSIPYEITRITGIDNSMVTDAPKFYEIAKEIVLFTEGAIFVAHNVNFDYSFIREEFDKLGYTFSKRQLCTVKLSRKAFAGLHSYSLGNLIRHFDINVSARHRALDDALATAEIFGMIISKKQSSEDVNILINRGVKETKLPESISIERLHSLPESTGVYYFYDVYGTVIYVGKSINIRTRIMQHFGQINAKSEKLMRQTNDIDFVETGSELIALLLESEEIKTLNPQINKAQKTKLYPYCVYYIEDEKGFINFGTKKDGSKGKSAEKILSYHGSLQSGKSTLSYVRELYALCEEKLIIEGTREKKCIYYSMKECLGACKDEEAVEAYNERASDAIIFLTKVFDNDFIIVTEGRNIDELGLVLIEDKLYKGYGYISKDEANMGIEEMKEAIESRYSSAEAAMIIIQYLKENKALKIIKI